MSSSSLLKPAIRLFKKLHFPSKFFLVSAFFLVPIIYFSSSIIYQRTITIDLMEEQRAGLQYLAKLRPLAEHIAQIRGMTNAYLNGKKNLLSKIENKHQTVETDFIALNEKNTLYGELFDTNNSVQKIEQQWTEYKENSLTGSAPDVFSKYTDLINNILALKRTIAESSTLMLSQNISDFYMMESLVKNLPFIAETMGKSRGLGAGITAAGKISND